jgi:membrane protein
VARSVTEGSTPLAETTAGPEQPDQPTDLPRQALPGVLKRTLREFAADHLTDQAAALTYYGVLSIFPMLVVIVSVLGIIGHSVTQPLITNLGTLAPGSARSILISAIRNVQSHRGTAGAVFVVSLVTALWSASGYVAAFMRASNIVWDVDEGRPFWKTYPLRLAVTVVTVVLLTLSAAAVVFTGSLAARLGRLIGVGATAVQVWDIAKWPLMALVVVAILAVLYWAGPNVRQPGISWLSPGGVLAVVLWLIVSALFALYVTNFSSYNRTYGTLASVIVFLVWLWLTNLVILLGAEFNAELERGRQIEAGHPPEAEPYLPVRDAPSP